MIKIVSDGKALDAVLVDEKTLSVLNEDRLRLLRALAEKPGFATELAKRLRMHPQTAYYHLRILLSQKLIRLERFEEKQGGIAKRYVSCAQGLALALGPWKPFGQGRRKVPAYLNGFVKDGFLDAKIVVGSPEPHGKYRARGSEFPAIELSAYLAQFGEFEHPLYYLDTEAQGKVLDQNLVLVGGPKVNQLVQAANPHLPIRFGSQFEIESTRSGKKYGEDVGIVQTAPSLFAEGRKILVAAGLSHHTTRVAVLALLRKKTWYDETDLAHVVQGFDEDGDGIVDAVEVLE